MSHMHIVRAAGPDFWTSQKAAAASQVQVWSSALYAGGVAMLCSTGFNYSRAQWQSAAF